MADQGREKVKKPPMKRMVIHSSGRDGPRPHQPKVPAVQQVASSSSALAPVRQEMAAFCTSLGAEVDWMALDDDEVRGLAAESTMGLAPLALKLPPEDAARVVAKLRGLLAKE